MLLKATTGALVMLVMAGAPIASSAQMAAGNGKMMSRDHAMKPMTKSQMAMMAKCKKMSPAMMQKSKKCRKMMALHPEM